MEKIGDKETSVFEQGTQSENMEEEKYKIYINRKAGFFAVELTNCKYRVQVDYGVFENRDKLPKEFSRSAIVSGEEFHDEFLMSPGFEHITDFTKWQIDGVRTFDELFNSIDLLKKYYKGLEREGWKLEYWTNGEIGLYFPLEIKPFRKETPKDNTF